MVRKTNKFINKYAHHEDELFLEELYSFIADTEKSDQSDYYRFGYETFGIVLYSFCTWMISDLQKEGITKVLFFARDGHIMKQAFELFEDSCKFESRYIYVSRRSLRVPQLYIEGNDRKQVIIPTRYITIKDLLYSVGLDSRNYHDVIKHAGLDENLVIEADNIDKGKVKELLDNIWDDVIDNSRREYLAAKEYLNQLDIGGKVAVVDIGWRGSMQFFLQRIIDSLCIDAQLRGYYITLSSDLIKGQDMHGFLGNVDGHSAGCDKLRGYIGLIELLFSFDEGSTEKYVLHDGKVEVIKLECEYAGSKDELDEISRIKEIQRGALDFIKAFIEYNDRNLRAVDAEKAFVYLNDFAMNPSMSDVEMFERFTSQNNGTITNLVECKAAWYYLLHPGQLKKDLYVSRWRIGFLKKLFRIKLPYKALFNVLMTVAKRKR